MIDVQAMRTDVVNFLTANGYMPRDADGTDFEHHQATFPARLRFKVGTVRGEVTVVPVVDGRAGKVPIRILSAAGFEASKVAMKQMMDAFA